jgi:hypothetical protein
MPQVLVDDYELDLEPWQEQRRQSPAISFALSLHLHSDIAVGKTPLTSMATLYTTEMHIQHIQGSHKTTPYTNRLVTLH